MSNKIVFGELVKLRFRDYLRKMGLSFTPQRDEILQYLSQETAHFHADDLIFALRAKKVRVSRATVYRTLSHLQEAGLIRQVSTDQSQCWYEVSGNSQHHEHMMCTKCGTIIEFTDPLLEQRIDEVAIRNGFKIINHTVQLFGVCGKCVVKVDIK